MLDAWIVDLLTAVPWYRKIAHRGMRWSPSKLGDIKHSMNTRLRPVASMSSWLTYRLPEM